ncbi:hypothetical protein LWI29_035524 [Acer saccharum]|uniref:Uncharacterized protein n=1 Tax=Acer saccharum TaxID=4024 RepID=A0AA39S925_ACESA|nr:hypothetical protein LWI29_035524 [Acer saccharum]
MKINMTHNDNIKTFDDISLHVKLEDERLEATKASGQLYMAESIEVAEAKTIFEELLMTVDYGLLSIQIDYGSCQPLDLLKPRRISNLGLQITVKGFGFLFV